MNGLMKGIKIAMNVLIMAVTGLELKRQIDEIKKTRAATFPGSANDEGEVGV